MAVFLSIFLVVSFTICIYILERNEVVYEFRSAISAGCFGYMEKRLNEYREDGRLVTHMADYKKEEAVAYEILDKYSYENMLFSIKPLKLKGWFSEDEVKLIEEGRVYRGHTITW